jgi:hypothetical protein
MCWPTAGVHTVADVKFACSDLDEQIVDVDHDWWADQGE